MFGWLRRLRAEINAPETEQEMRVRLSQEAEEERTAKIQRGIQWQQESKLRRDTETWRRKRS